jgi:hypothetical protein
MERHFEVWRVQKLNQRESAFRLFACELYQRQTAEPPPWFSALRREGCDSFRGDI